MLFHPQQWHSNTLCADQILYLGQPGHGEVGVAVESTAKEGAIVIAHTPHQSALRGALVGDG